jgi:predicted DNA-binding protein (MmcQ/YjbR family)
MPVADHLIQPLREICCAYPDVEEQSEGSVGDPVFKAGGKIFAMQHGVDGRPSIWMKAPAGVQEALVASNPLRAFRPPYVGNRGWVGLWLDDATDWAEVADLVDDSWRMTAKKTVIREYDAQRDVAQ